MAFKLIGETRGDEVNLRYRIEYCPAWYEYARAVFDIYYGGSKHYLETRLQVVFWRRLKKLKTRYVVAFKVQAAERMQWDSIPYEEEYYASGGSSCKLHCCKVCPFRG